MRTEITIEGPRDTVSLLMWKLLNEHESVRLESFISVRDEDRYAETGRTRVYLFINRPGAGEIEFGPELT